MEIEKKFLIEKIPENLDIFLHKEIIQGYLCTNPVVRIRKHGEDYILTYKGKGLMVRQEENLPLNKEAFEHLVKKVDGNLIHKIRYEIPLSQNGKEYTIELDQFLLPKQFFMAEVEFESVEDANGFSAPDWFGEEVTENPAYHNSNMIGI